MIPQPGEGGVRSLQDKAVRGAIWTSLHATASTPLVLVGTVVVARTLGPVGFGTFALLLVAYTIGSNATNFGVNFAAIQWCASAEAAKDRPLTRAIISRTGQIRLLIQWPLLALGGLVLLRASAWPVRVTYLLATAAYLLFLGGSVALIAENRTAVGAKLAFAINALTQVTIVVTAVLSHSAETVWVSRMVVMAIGEMATLGFLDKDLRASVVHLRRVPHLPEGFMTFSRSLWVAGLLSAIVYSRSEIFVMRIVGQTVSAGIFALAFGISYQITAPVDSLLGPLLPASAALVAAHPKLAREALLRGLRFSSLLSGLVYACLVPPTYFAVPIIYGPSFHGVAVPFLCLAWISVTQSVCHPIAALITGRRGGQVLVRANLIAVVADVGLAISLIPHFGIAGAVVANAVAQAVSLTVLAADEKRNLGLRVRELLGATQGWVRAPLATGIALAAGHAVGHRAFLGADVVVAFGVGTLAYLALVRFRLRPLTSGDQEALLRSVPGGLRGVVGLLLRLLPHDHGASAAAAVRDAEWRRSARAGDP